MSDSSYNGWANRVAWLFNLYFGDSLDEEAERIGTDPEGGSWDDRVRTMAAYLKNYWEETLDEADIPAWLNDFIDDDIDFEEVAHSMLYDYRERFDIDGEPLTEEEN